MSIDAHPPWYLAHNAGHNAHGFKPSPRFEVDMVTIEEDLEMLATAVEMGINPFPPPKKKRPWGKFALASFMTMIMLSAVSKLMMRFV